MTKPILDGKPTTRGKNWSFSKIQEMKGIKPGVAPRPAAYTNPLAPQTAPRDQDARGTCCGQSGAHCYDIEYMTLMKDLPTAADIAQFKTNVIDQIGTTHDILYPESASAESFYQMSRKIGNVTYPSGSEILFVCRAWCQYGMNLESQWHTDKLGTCVWMYPPGPRVTNDGGIDPVTAATFAATHKAAGYAQVGTVAGDPTWDQVCDAIWQNGYVLGAIPVYENYTQMQGGDGTFPDPSGDIAGYHALCFYGYDDNYLYLLHSWGTYCNRFGAISKNYFTYAIDEIQFFTILDQSEVLIARAIYTSCAITSNVPAQIQVDGKVVGNTPITISIEKGTTHTITASATGYVTQTVTVGDSVTSLSLTLEAVPQPVKSWFQRFLDFLIALFKRL